MLLWLRCGGWDGCFVELVVFVVVELIIVVEVVVFDVMVVFVELAELVVFVVVVEHHGCVCWGGVLS